MKRKKSVFALLLAVVLCLGLSVPAFAAEGDTGFSDVAADAWYAQSAMYVRDHGVMNGSQTAATVASFTDASDICF